MLTLIAILIVLVAELVFDYAASAGATNWYIFYFSCMYISYILIVIDVVFRENSISMQSTAIAFSLLFLALLIRELSFINVPFDEYIVGVNNNKVKTVLGGIISVILIFITITAWEKRLSKR